MGQFEVAQTNVQLYRQLWDMGWTSADLEMLQSCYDLATVSFAGLLRPSGKPFLAHLVGVASLTAIAGGAAEEVAAALLHSYRLRGVRVLGRRVPLLRPQFPADLDDAVRSLIEHYERWHRSLRTGNQIEICVDSPPVADRKALLLHIANELEEVVDDSALLSGSPKRSREYLQRLLGMATDLGFSEFAVRIEALLDDSRKSLPRSLFRQRSSSFEP